MSFPRETLQRRQLVAIFLAGMIQQYEVVEMRLPRYCSIEMRRVDVSPHKQNRILSIPGKLSSELCRSRTLDEIPS
jgi:hypothetical protein